MYAQSVCVCVPNASETVCSYFHMWLHCFDMLLCPHLLTKTGNSSSWDGSPTSF